MFRYYQFHDAHHWRELHRQTESYDNDFHATMSVPEPGMEVAGTLLIGLVLAHFVTRKTNIWNKILKRVG